ncbi:MAG: transglutaminase family protein [Planctomycetes bacterium]|nr:transglutaminase family protein [Planctomycetota bacterium]
MSESETREFFCRVVELPEEELDLAVAALLIGKEEDPTVAVQAYVERLEALARRVVASAAESRPGIDDLNRVLFREEGFAGDNESYYAPENSFLHRVLDRHKGIPITLSLVYMEVARRAGLSIQGVGFPGHFLVKLVEPDGETVIDPFNGGAVVTAEKCQQLLDAVYGGQLRFDDRFLAASNKRQILARVLNNLKGIYLALQDFPRALGVVERMCIVEPGGTTEVRDRGMIHYRLGHFSCAVSDLRRYLALEPPPAEAELVRETIKTITRVIARLN